MRHPASRHRTARTTLSNLVGPLATTVTLTMLMHLSIAAACCAPASPATVAAAPLTPGVLQHRTLLSDPLLAYYLYVPKSVGPGARLFVTVHGISRRALQHASMFAPFAEQQGVVLIAPYFPADRFPDYQRMSRAGRGERSDQALERIVAEVGRLSGANTSKLFMFGYSGGAQFVHRFAMAHPERVARFVVGAAGWYTFPDPTMKYPLGIQAAKQLPGVDFDPHRFLAVPAKVLVGERDITQNGAMRDSAKLDSLQGSSRLERGRKWVQTMQHLARANGLATRYEFATLPRSRHWFRQCMRRGDMGRTTFEFLFREHDPT